MFLYLDPDKVWQDDDDDAVYHKLLWTAPELLRLSKDERPQYGTKKGDVYSFGVIAQEVLYRAPPYFVDTETSQGKTTNKKYSINMYCKSSDNTSSIIM